MSKISKLKEAIKNPPPERLAKTEYRSHLFQAFGITFVCIILVMKGFWYIIFAFIFGVGISYSQGMTAYQKYRAIISYKEPEKREDYEKDISPSRRRSKIIQDVIPFSTFLSSLLAVVISLCLIDPTMPRWILMLVYPMAFAIFFTFIYFFLLYWISYPIYKRRIKK